MKNTFEKGSVRVLVYKDNENGAWYGTALELNLTVDGSDKGAVLYELNQAIIDYIESARTLADVSILNQDPDPELVALWDSKIKNSTPIVSPYTPYFAGVETI